MTARLQAWIRQAQNDLAMAEFARSGQFYAQACYHCSQAAEKAPIGLLIGLGQDPLTQEPRPQLAPGSRAWRLPPTSWSTRASRVTAERTRAW